MQLCRCNVVSDTVVEPRIDRVVMVIAQVPVEILSEDQSTAGSKGNTDQRDSQNFPSPNILMPWCFFWQTYLRRRLSASIRHTTLPFPSESRCARPLQHPPHILGCNQLTCCCNRNFRVALGNGTIVHPSRLFATPVLPQQLKPGHQPPDSCTAKAALHPSGMKPSNGAPDCGNARTESIPIRELSR